FLNQRSSELREGVERAVAPEAAESCLEPVTAAADDRRGMAGPAGDVVENRPEAFLDRFDLVELVLPGVETRELIGRQAGQRLTEIRRGAPRGWKKGEGTEKQNEHRDDPKGNSRAHWASLNRLSRCGPTCPRVWESGGDCSDGRGAR